MSDDRIDPFWEFCYQTGIDPAGGGLDTGEEELIEDEEEFIKECCCHQVRRLNMIEQLPEGIRAETPIFLENEKKMMKECADVCADLDSRIEKIMEKCCGMTNSPPVTYLLMPP